MNLPFGSRPWRFGGSRPWRFGVLGAALLALPASATWSIVVVDPATGEVGVASATCVPGIALQNSVPTIVVGRGAAASQSLPADANTNIIHYEGFLNGKSPIAILGELEDFGTSFQQRQFGIVDFTHEPVSFSGAGAGESKPSATGVAGTVRYAIQGNVLTGPPVVEMAELALQETDGDLGQRLMAAMQAARSMGGDGRCSCSPFDPTGCGSPPDEFELSANVGFVYVARIGDADGGCTNPLGCAQGDYYLELTTSGTAQDPDPVEVLQEQYDAWRASKLGKADHLRSSVEAASSRLVADGVTSTQVRVQLADIEGVPLERGGATLSIAAADGTTPLVAIGPVLDLGAGAYEFEVTAGEQAGTSTLAIRVDDGAGAITLYPYLALEVEPSSLLHVGQMDVSVATGGSVPLVVNAGVAAAGGDYLLLGSAHGTHPGVRFEGADVPLNADYLFQWTLSEAGGRTLPGTVGTLDAAGRGEGTALVPAAGLRAWIGLRINFAALVRPPGQGSWTVSAPGAFFLVP